jgi:hypothetical protein
LQTTVVWNGIATSNVFAVDILNGVRFEGGNNFAGLRLGGVNLRLHGLALGGSGSLLADERFLFHSHCGFSSFIFYLTALRNTLVQAGCQTLCPRHQTLKLLKTMKGRRSFALRASPPFACTG